MPTPHPSPAPLTASRPRAWCCADGSPPMQRPCRPPSARAWSTSNPGCLGPIPKNKKPCRTKSNACASFARVEIHCDPANVRSAAVPRKLGYTHEATLKNRVQQLDTWRNSMVWTLFRNEVGASPAAKAPLEAYDAAGRRII